mmetsp:Transcript_3235/g.9932  ORF Transcript_3235/g.9932 Transcript_3235/m.9932 type:complete len:320 (+) Transcript_3235:207-1166(+)
MRSLLASSATCRPVRCVSRRQTRSPMYCFSTLTVASTSAPLRSTSGCSHALLCGSRGLESPSLLRDTSVAWGRRATTRCACPSFGYSQSSPPLRARSPICRETPSLAYCSRLRSRPSSKCALPLGGSAGCHVHSSLGWPRAGSLLSFSRSRTLSLRGSSRNMRLAATSGSPHHRSIESATAPLLRGAAPPQRRHECRPPSGQIKVPVRRRCFLRTYYFHLSPLLFLALPREALPSVLDGGGSHVHPVFPPLPYECARALHLNLDFEAPQSGSRALQPLRSPHMVAQPRGTSPHQSKPYLPCAPRVIPPCHIFFHGHTLL